MAGTIKLDGATFLEKDGGNYKITNTELKLKSSGNTIVDSSGNALVSESSGKVTLQGVTLGDSAVPNTPMMFRNKLINGNFDFWQRGPYQTSSGYGSADRWYIEHAGSSKTASQQSFTLGQTEVPGNPKYYLRHVVTSAAGSANGVVPSQRIEDVRTLAGKTATLSFWAKADANKNIVTEFVQYFGSGGSSSLFSFGIGPTTHSLTTSWQKFTATVSIPSISGKTLGTANDDWLGLYFWFDAGSDFNSRTNSLGQQSGTFDIAQVQLEEGSAATPFEQRPIGLELSLCQRYYQKSYDLSEKPGGSATYPTNGSYLGSYNGSEYVYSLYNTTYNQRLNTNIPLKTRMRSATGQTVKIYNPYNGDLNNVMQAGGGTSYATTLSTTSETSPSFYASVTGNSYGNSVGDIYRYQWVVENEL